MKPDPVKPAPDSAGTLQTDRAAACRQWLLKQQQALQEPLLRIRRTQGNEAIHAARVAARRMRSLLRAWQRECHPPLVAELRFELRNLGRLLAPVREADVRRQLVASLLRSPPTDLKHATALIMASLDQARAAMRHTLRHEFRAARCGRLLERIQFLTGDERLFDIARPGDTFAADADKLRKRVRKLRRQLSKVRQNHARLHVLRIRAKALRYRAEAVSELGTIELTDELKFLRKCQSLLGDMHDLRLLETWCDETSLDERLRQLMMARLELLSCRHQEGLSKLRAIRWRSSGTDEARDTVDRADRADDQP